MISYRRLTAQLHESNNLADHMRSSASSTSIGSQAAGLEPQTSPRRLALLRRASVLHKLTSAMNTDCDTDCDTDCRHADNHTLFDDGDESRQLSIGSPVTVDLSDSLLFHRIQKTMPRSAVLGTSVPDSLACHCNAASHMLQKPGSLPTSSHSFHSLVGAKEVSRDSVAGSRKRFSLEIGKVGTGNCECSERSLSPQSLPLDSSRFCGKAPRQKSSLKRGGFSDVRGKKNVCWKESEVRPFAESRCVSIARASSFDWPSDGDDTIDLVTFSVQQRFLKRRVPPALLSKWGPRQR